MSLLRRFSSPPRTPQLEMVLAPQGSARIDVLGQDFYQRELLTVAGPKTEDGVSVWKHAALVPDAARKAGGPAFVVQIGGRTVAHLSSAQADALQRYLERIGHPHASLGGIRCRINGGWKRRGDEGGFGIALYVSDDLEAEIQQPFSA